MFHGKHKGRWGEININPGPGGSKKTLKMEDHSNAGCPCSLSSDVKNNKEGLKLVFTI